MSTPISDLPDDIEDFDEHDYAPIPRRSKGKKWCDWRKHKDLLTVFIAVVVASYISIDSFRYSLPPQVFTFGDTPLNALIVTLVYAVMQFFLKSVL